MAAVNRPGRYFAQVMSFGWDAEKLKEKKYELRIGFQVLSMWDGKGWPDGCKGLEISGWFYPFKKDGGKNAGFRTQMMEAFGWDGEKLSGIPLANQYCQIEVEEHLYENRKSLRVNWIRHADTPGASDATAGAAPSELDALDEMYAAASNDTTKAAPAVPPANRPAGPR